MMQIKIEQGKALAPVIVGTTEIPVPGSAYPYVGHMFSLGELPCETISAWHKELGPIIKIRMGVQTWISIDSPQMAHKILVTNGAKTSQRPRSVFGHDIYSGGGKGMVYSSPNLAWKKIRAAVVAAIAPSQIELHMASIQNEAKKLVDRLLDASAKTEKGVYPFKQLQLYVMNTVTLIGFGKTFSSTQDPEFIKVSELIDEGFKLGGVDYDLATYFPIFSIFNCFSGTQAYMHRFIKTRRDPIFRELIKEAFQTDGPNLLKYLKEGEFNLSEEETIISLSDLIGAGTDTNSVFLSWTVIIMCHYPQVQRKVCSEIDGFIEQNGRLPLFSERLELPFCISVMKECMRYKPVTPFGIPHQASEDVEIDGYIIPKGATIISNMVSMHKNSEFYPERPHDFIPERFMDAPGTTLAASNGKIEERDHFNFGWGRRMCPAIHLAEVEMFIAFIEIMARCFIEPTKDGMSDINGAKNGGLAILPLPYKVKFTKRTNSLFTEDLLD